MDTESDSIKQNVPNRYSLVVLAAKRAKQLKEGAPALIQTESTNSLTIALEEIAAGKINYIEAVETEDDEAAGAALTASSAPSSSTSSSAQPTAMQMLEESLAEAERAAHFAEPEQTPESEAEADGESDADGETIEAEAETSDYAGATTAVSEEE